MKPPTCRSCGVAEWRHTCLVVTKGGAKDAPTPDVDADAKPKKGARK